MIPADNPVAMPPAEELQFEHADFTATPAPLACAACARPIAESYYEINRKVLCGGCRDSIVARFTGGSGLLRFLRASLFGTLAALAGSFLYFLVLVLTGYQIALIAIAVGLMVGTAVRKGTRYRGGWPYQCLAVFLTYTAIVSSYISMAIVHAVKGVEDPAAVAPVDPARPARLEKAAPGPKKIDAAERVIPNAGNPEPEPKLGLGLLLGLLVLLMAHAYAAPFMSGAQNIIGLLIIFFGLQQAWRLNRKVHLAINGPFQVNSAGSPPREAPAHV